MGSVLGYNDDIIVINLTQLKNLININKIPFNHTKVSGGVKKKNFADETVLISHQPNT